MGRQIIDCSLLANECIDAILKVGRPWIVCQIDIEKAYDHVSWDFLDWVLQQMGYGIKGRKWMKICISSLSFSILVNEFPKGFFKGSKGLRHGDLLSSYLFIMVVRLLGGMVSMAESIVLLEGFSSIVGGLSIPFIQFVDESLFAKGRPECYEKSKMYSPHS